MLRLTFLFLVCAFAQAAFAQNIIVEGYTYETNNSGYLNEAKVKVTELESGYDMSNTTSNMEGFFTFELPAIGQYVVKIEKPLFETEIDTLDMTGKTPGSKVFMKVPMTRKPGYIFEVTMAEKRFANEEVDAINSSLVEAYNNSTDEQVLTLKNHPSPFFKVNFERGNHYTVLIRKKGFYNKRLEAHVDIDGCILCFEGVGGINPGVTDNLTRGMQAGTLLTNIELERIDTARSMVFRNILYDYNSADIRPDAAKELDNIVSLLRNNPALICELGSHTDSRGGDPYNLELSERRAQSAVNYIVTKGGIGAGRIKGKGYGETRIINNCKNGVECTDQQHQANRRTELRVLGYGEDPFENMSLADIIRNEKMELMLLELENQQEIQVSGDQLPEEIRRDLERQQAGGAPNNEPATRQNTTPDETGETSKSGNSGSFKYNSDLLSGGDNEEVAIPDPTKAAPTPTPAKAAALQFGLPTIAADYSGFRVQYRATKTNMKMEAEKKAFPDITLEERANGWWAFLTGDFKNRAEAELYLKEKVIAQYPDAFVVEYREGNRIN